MTADRLARLHAAVRARPEPVLAAAIATLGGLVVLWLSVDLFPYHSSNHDEAVYLQQAALLLDGQVQLVAGNLADVVHPWFFVQDGGRLYPKYSPVPAAMYAISMGLLGEPRVTLALVAAGNTGLIYVLASQTANRRVGLVAAVVFAAAPLQLITSSVFLPYAPTTLLNLSFAVAYVRSVRRESVHWAGVAGIAIGLAFFARPFTAVLFAMPFVAHALWTVWQSVRQEGHWPLSAAVRRQLVVAGGGLVFVCVTFAYNAYLTGDPLLFPFEAFAPQDGPGFGRRRILGHSVDYTPALALEANGYVLQYLLTRWFTAGVLGTAIALVGLAVTGIRWRNRSQERFPGFVLAGLLVTIPVGNLFFWGNYNVLATMSDPTDGLVSQFGPFYHFDLLVPLSVFAAVAVVSGWDWLARVADRRLDDGMLPGPVPARTALPGIALVGLLLLGGVANAALLAGPVERNAGYTDKFEEAYEPFEEQDLEDAVVLLPTPYGDWLNHPFQPLRNDGDLDGSTVYVMDDGSANFAVVDAYPDRSYYRYTYHGEWAPHPDYRVTPRLEPLDVRSGERLRGETTVGIPIGVDHATVRLEAEESDEYATYPVTQPDEELRVNWTVAPGNTSVGGTASVGGTDGTDHAVALNRTDELFLSIRLVQSDGSTLTYRQEVVVRTAGESVEAIWPPEKTVCPLVDYCGTRGTYLPEHPEEHRDGVSFETTLSQGA